MYFSNNVLPPLRPAMPADGSFHLSFTRQPFIKVVWTTQNTRPLLSSWDELPILIRDQGVDVCFSPITEVTDLLLPFHLLPPKKQANATHESSDDTQAPPLRQKLSIQPSSSVELYLRNQHSLFFGHQPPIALWVITDTNFHSTFPSLSDPVVSTIVHLLTSQVRESDIQKDDHPKEDDHIPDTAQRGVFLFIGHRNTPLPE